MDAHVDEVRRLMLPRELLVRRCWRRDGTSNYMRMEAAILNLIRFHKSLSVQDIATRLRAGEVMDSPRAAFALASCSLRELLPR